MFRMIWNILRDERGALLDWGLDWMAANERGEPPSIYDYQWPNVKELQNRLSANVLGRIGNPTRYSTNPNLVTTQPNIEKQTESEISKRLGSLPTAEQYKSQVTAAKTQDIARERESTEEQVGKEREMYNRLGLSSSTPWMSRAGEIGDESLMRQGDISSKYDMYGLDYNLKADQLADQIAKGWTSLGGTLGSQQRGYQQDTMQLSLSDLIRMANEEQMYGNQALNYLGKGAVSPSQGYTSGLFDWQQPNTYDWLSSGTKEIDIDSIMAILGMM